MTLAEEKEILEKARSDPRQFGPLYDHYYPRIFGYVYRRSGRYELARDIAADTFLKAVLKLPAFQWRGGGCSAWLYRIATNELRQFYRRRTSVSKVLGELPEQYAIEKELYRIFEEEKAEMEIQLQQHQDFIRVQRALLSLDARYQEVLSLRFFEQKSVREIAEILGKNEGTVKSLLSRGADKIAGLLAVQP